MSEYAICVATFYEDLAERLVNGATEAFAENDVAPTSVHAYEVAGAFELPLAAKWCAESGRFAGVACLGAVIKGETDHYDFVCAESARGIQQVALDTGIPCSFGVITCDTMEQALERAGVKAGNKGAEATAAAIEQANAFRAEAKLPRGKRAAAE